MSSQITILNILFRGILNDFDEDEEDDFEFGVIDAKTDELKDELNSLQPYRFPSLELEYLGNSGDVELIFKFRTNWMDREADLEDYIDEVQTVIESGMDMIINEKQMLGYTTQ
ncbi:MAG: hypothetical protein ACW99A_00145 [Candidatus Kariarchaeaceae archaeon]|jgi:hypothetical protein